MVSGAEEGTDKTCDLPSSPTVSPTALVALRVRDSVAEPRACGRATGISRRDGGEGRVNKSPVQQEVEQCVSVRLTRGYFAAREETKGLSTRVNSADEGQTSGCAGRASRPRR